MGLFATLSINNIQHHSALSYAECGYAECRDYLNVITHLLNVFMLCRYPECCYAECRGALEMD